MVANTEGSSVFTAVWEVGNLQPSQLLGAVTSVLQEGTMGLRGRWKLALNHTAQ